MANPISALHEILRKVPSAGETAGVTLREIPSFHLTQIAAWPETLAEVSARVAQGLQEGGRAPAPGRVMALGDALMLRVEPLKYWLLSTDQPLQLPKISAEEGATLDISHARTLLSVSGPRAADLLMHYLPLDLREAAFAEGALASSAMHHVGVTLWRSGTEFHMALPRSFAATLTDLLCQSAQQYGLRLG
ncbi:sarcosine oxidase subunit gamma [Pararhodobacter oceanensis]|uniref:Sarcosine oxidase subunit gamma n=2 Tax=Pararhodobacter oceanensis TaxID=2172121 RepID=A0A2T8HPF5_9RHOB|nr:sarcosine oxidase subunit gamma [Pararhodobacter oceanensis]